MTDDQYPTKKGWFALVHLEKGNVSLSDGAKRSPLKKNTPKQSPQTLLAVQRTAVAEEHPLTSNSAYAVHEDKGIH